MDSNKPADSGLLVSPLSFFLMASTNHQLIILSSSASVVMLPQPLLVYVDDIILTRNSIDAIHHITTLLDQTFKIKDLGILKFFLGLKVARSSRGIHLCQRKYTLDILADFGMLGSCPISTPTVYSTRLHASAFQNSCFTSGYKCIDFSLYASFQNPRSYLLSLG